MRRLTALLFALSVTLVACGGSDDNSGTSSSSDAGGGTVATSDVNGGGSDSGGGSDDVAGTITIADFAYGDPLTVAPGALVAVVNEDSQEHSATAEDGSFDTGLFGQGEQMTFTAPSEAGTYNILCTAHPQMAGELIVSG